jgi:hypothetical protein
MFSKWSIVVKYAIKFELTNLRKKKKKKETYTFHL